LITDAAQLQVRQAGLRQQLTALQQMQAGFGDRQQALPQFVKNEEGLKQQFDLAQKNYSSLRSKQSEIRLAEIQATANARVLQPALLPRSASNQSRNLLLLAGCGAGAFLGIAAAFGADMLDRHLKTADEIRVGLPYSLLGLIPRFDPALKRIGDGAISLPDDRPPAIGDRLAQEAFRMLQTNLKFLRPDHKCQTIVISSALAAEGKSTVAAHLARTMAQSGHRVLLIDANLRSPVQHTLWDLVNHTGLSDWMVAAPVASQVDVQVDVQGAAVVQPVMDKLDVMTAGVVPPDATTSLESTAFRQHLAALALSYDYVLIDAPPLLGTADAVLLSKIADGLLLVARLGVVDDRSARAVQDLLHRSGATVLGLVVN
jgi:polysaccharide biosynthesis transport protein